MHRGRRHLAAVAVATSMALSACAGGSGGGSGEVDPEGSLTVATVTVPSGFDPHRETQRGERPYWFLVFDRLTQQTPEGELEPMLATEWEISDDAQSITFTLRDDVEFHDGTLFDAEAVKANLERAATIEGSTQTQDLGHVDSIEVVSPTEVTILLDSPDAEFPELMSGPAGAMISPTAIASDADLSSDPGDAGSGPYLVERFVPNETTIFTRAAEENWDPDAGRLAELEIRFVQDDRTIMSSLRSGEIDVAYVNPFNMAVIREAEQLDDSGDFTLVQSESGVINALLMRGDRLSDPEVREALAKAIDTQSISDELLQGTCEATDQVVREGFPGHVEDFDSPLAYDPDGARQLLGQAGVSDLEIEVSFISGREQIPSVIQENLNAVGVTSSLTPLASIEVLSAWRAGELDTWAYQISPHVAPARTGGVILGPMGFGEDVSEVSDAADRARAAVDLDDRETALQEMNAAVIDNALLVPICHFDSRYLVTEDVIDFDAAPRPDTNFMIDLRHVAIGE